ncbi:MAG: DUF4390 domain-containing protein [Magnetococcales bacterium]|nr:DUF4390 domain-containing protein [Magnetococcales bacterium]
MRSDPFIRGLFLALAVALAACALPSEVPVGTTIREASVFLQGGRLYGSALLDPKYLAKITAMIKKGEPILGVYRFRLYQVDPWLPDVKVVDVSLSRRLVPHLITQKFELREGEGGQVQYADDLPEALQFLGHPNYLPLVGGDEPLLPGEYHLDVRFSLVPGVTNPVIRMLKRWLVVSDPAEHRYQAVFLF